MTGSRSTLDDETDDEPVEDSRETDPRPASMLQPFTFSGEEDDRARRVQMKPVSDADCPEGTGETEPPAAAAPRGA